ncbi:dTDP-4-dehydrorhamnose reductase [Roseobacter sp. HKCCA0434]|uniref:dTDP-4-dehydrorhamnose reductase n=1 Tax=Roseobacter sp. HKCCA0434 TaxID=3079297 RepID=UPI0029059DFC|nr:dTDP-4-dehydrorhamnose reductase [Roseobacter sp. HKCCA0434]
MRLAITGRNGQVARALAEMKGIEPVFLARPDMDLAQPESVLPALRDAGAQAVINAAAWTAVDAAEDDAEAAFAVNEGGARAVAQAAAELGIPVVQISTDYVFDGSGERPWREDDPTGPLGVYGASKLAGERAVAAATENHAILRTSWVFSPHGTNFAKTMLRLGAERDTLRVVDDQIGAPTAAHDIAQGAVAVARNLAAGPDAALRGTFHMAACGATSWAGFARETFAVAGMDIRVDGIATEDYPTPAARPRNSRLDCAKILSAHGIALPDWRDGVARVVTRLMEEST